MPPDFGRLESFRFFDSLIIFILVVKIPVVLTLLKNSLVIRGVMLRVNRESPAKVFAHIQ